MKNELHEEGKKATQVELESNLFVTDSCVSKVFKIPAGIVLGKHEHNYSHLSFLMEGEAVLHQGDAKRIIKAPLVVEVKANVLHAVEAITDVVWACTHGANENDLTTYE